jgi:hypothetical protein
MPRTNRSKSSLRKKGMGSKQKKKNMKRKPFRKNVNPTVSIEKKVFDFSQGSLSFAQTIGSFSGHNYSNPTPAIANGTAVNQRIGNKVMLTGARLDIEFTGQTSQNNAVKYRWYLIRMPQQGAAQMSGDPTDEFLDENPFATGIYDWHSSIDHERSQSFKVVATGTGRLAADQIAGQTSRAQLRKYLKLGHIVKYDNDIPGTVVENQYRIIFLADSGDVTAATGLTAKYNIRWYYVDN